MRKLSNVAIKLGIILMFSCESSTTENKTENATEKPQITIEQYQSLLDSLNAKTISYWDSINSLDINKMQSIKRLLQEISYIPEHDEHKLQTVTNLFNEVEKISLKQNSVSDYNIDNYDMMQDSLIRNVIQLTQNTKNSENFPLVNELINDILTADEKVIVSRVHYDEWAFAFNAALLIDEDLIKLTSYNSKSPLGTFMIKE